MHSRGFTTSDRQRNVMGQSTEMSTLICMLFLDIPKSLIFLMEIFYILVLIYVYICGRHIQCIIVVLYKLQALYLSEKILYNR